MSSEAMVITAVVVFKSLWWILPFLGMVEAVAIIEYFDR